MTQSASLYQSVILEHSRSPRGAQALEDATHRAEGFNPICGDKILVTVKATDNKILEVGFTAQCCALCRASASVLVDTLRSRTVVDAQNIARQFEAMLTGGGWSFGGDAEAFAAMRDFPARAKCVLLPWKTVLASLSAPRVVYGALQSNSPAVTTEMSGGEG